MVQTVKLPPSIDSTPGPSVVVQFQMQFTADAVPVQCPGFRVAPGQVVTIYPINGSRTNAGAALVAQHRDLLFIGTNSARVLPNAADVAIPWPVDNTANIWAMGSTNDGLLVVVTQVAIG